MNDPSLIEELCASVEPLVYKLVRLYYYRLPSQHRRWVDLEDLVQEGRHAAIRAAAIYNEARGIKYVTLAHRYIATALGHQVAVLSAEKRGRGLSLVDYNDELTSRPQVEPYEAAHHNDLLHKLRTWLLSLTKAQRSILVRYYGLYGASVQTPAKMASRFRVTPGAVRARLKEARRLLRQLASSA